MVVLDLCLLEVERQEELVLRRTYAYAYSEQTTMPQKAADPGWAREAYTCKQSWLCNYGELSTPYPLLLEEEQFPRVELSMTQPPLLHQARYGHAKTQKQAFSVR